MINFLFIVAKESIFFTLLFFVLAFAIHADGWLSTPFELFGNLGIGNYSWHPLIYTLCLYLFILTCRGVLGLIRKALN